MSFLIKLQACVCNFIKKEALAQVLSCEFCEISKNTFLQNTSGWLLLIVVTGKSMFFVIGPFMYSLFYLPSDMAVLYGNVAFSILLLPAKKRYSSFLKKVSFSKVSIENV